LEKSARLTIGLLLFSLVSRKPFRKKLAAYNSSMQLKGGLRASGSQEIWL
jgi:hypothetical protein